MNLVPSNKGGVAAGVLSLVTVVVNMAVEFGVDLTQGQQGAISTAAAALVALVLTFTRQTPAV